MKSLSPEVKLKKEAKRIIFDAYEVPARLTAATYLMDIGINSSNFYEVFPNLKAARAENKGPVSEAQILEVLNTIKDMERGIQIV